MSSSTTTPNISGPIVPRTYTALPPNPNLPGISFGATSILSSASGGELYTRTPNGSNSVGNTMDSFGYIFLNASNINQTAKNIISGFGPDFYIDTKKNVNIAYQYAENLVYLIAPSGAFSRTIYEIIKLNYEKQDFLRNLSGDTASAIVGITWSHETTTGGQTIYGNQIYYRRLGILPP